MNRTIVLASLFALVAARCAPTASTSEGACCDGAMALDGGGDASSQEQPSDARPSSDGGIERSDATADANATPLEPLPADPRCASLDELALAVNQVTGALVPTYERSGLVAMRDSSSGRCGQDFGDSGDDSSVKFTAPRSGSWRFTAVGRGISTLVVRRGCSATGACLASNAALRGDDLINRVTSELSLQQGETVEISADGCPAGARCSVAFRAERWGSLRCYAEACPQNHECSVQSDDSPRVSCSPTIDLREAPQINVRAISAQLDAQSQRFVFDLELDPGSFWYLTTRVDRWMLADGTFVTPAPGAYTVFSVDMRNGRGVPLTVAVPDARYVGAEFAMLGHRATARSIVRFTPWRRPSLGERCSATDLHALCVAGARCDERTSTCVRAERLEVTSASVFHGDTFAFRGVVRGVRGDRSVRVLIAGLDERGVWRDASYPGFVPARSDLRTEFESDLYASLPEGRYTHARIVLDDGASRSSPMIVAIEAPRTALAGERCEAADVVCASGLACVSAVTGQRCEPPAQRDPCALDRATWAPEWAPRTDTSVIEGFGYGSASQLDPAYACGSQERRSWTPTDVVFVAPRAARYRFEGRGLSELKSLTLCTQQDCQGASAWDSVLTVSRELREGERFLLSLATFPRAGLVTVRAKRIEE